MKKLFIYISAVLMLISAAIPANAADGCTHSYRSEHFAATCVEAAHTVYTCGLCGDTYSVRDDSFTPPAGYWMHLSGNREGDTLTVTMAIGNNPGTWGFHVDVKYNSAALRPVSMQNGTVWEDSEVYIVDHSTYINYSSQNDELADIHDNGTLFSVTFDILDASLPYGIALSYKSADIMSADYIPGDPVYGFPLTITSYNTVGKGELSGHSYGEGIVTLRPGHGTEGVMTYTCTACGAERTEVVPALPARLLGDIYEDGLINAKDANLLIQLTNGTLEAEDENQFYAADVCCDGLLNGKDGNLLTQVINGDATLE